MHFGIFEWNESVLLDLGLSILLISFICFGLSLFLGLTGFFPGQIIVFFSEPATAISDYLSYLNLWLIVKLTDHDNQILVLYLYIPW